MGRAYEVRKASIQKNGAVKAKMYSTFAKEIYLAAKNGGTDPLSNPTLKRWIDKAKNNQIPSDIINRAIDKVNKGITEDYSSVLYEAFGRGGANILIKGLTDNVNRLLSYIRPALTKSDFKMGSTGSVSYMYDHLAIISFSGMSEDEVLEVMINNDVDVINVETDDNMITVYAAHSDFYKVKKCLEEAKPDIKFDLEEITMLARDKVSLTDDDKAMFDKLIKALDDIEDVSDYYHNVNE